MNVPTLTNGGLILLVLAIAAAYFIWRYFRNTDDLLGRRCWQCGEPLHRHTPANVRWCSEYCQQRWHRESR